MGLLENRGRTHFGVGGKGKKEKKWPWNVAVESGAEEKTRTMDPWTIFFDSMDIIKKVNKNEK